MSLRIQIGTSVSATDGSTTYFSSQDSGQAQPMNGFASVSSDTFVLPATTQPLTLSLGNVQAVAGLYLEVSAAAAVTLNGEATPISLTPSGGATTAKLLLMAPLASIALASATPGVTVQGRYVVYGDAS